MDALCDDLLQLDIGAKAKQRYKRSAIEYNEWWIKEAKRARCDDVQLEETIRALMVKTDDLLNLAITLDNSDYDLLRFMTSPVISKDRLRTFAACEQLPALSELLDDKLFPWLLTSSHPTATERDMAIHSLSRQMQNVQSAASLRTRHEAYQKEDVEKMLLEANYVRTPSMTASALTTRAFTSKLTGIRLKPDMVVCNKDGDLLLLEFKACGDRTNSIKRMQEMSAKKAILLESLREVGRTIQYVIVLFGHFVEQSVDATRIGYIFQHELGGPSCPIQNFLQEEKGNSQHGTEMPTVSVSN